MSRFGDEASDAERLAKAELAGEEQEHWANERGKQFRFRSCTHREIIQAWRVKENPKSGAGLTASKFESLVEEWFRRFDDWPPGTHASEDDAEAAGVDATNDNEPEAEPELEDDTMLRIKDVTRMTGLRQLTIYKMRRKGRFPEPMKLGEQAVGWPKQEFDEWLEQRDEQRKEYAKLRAARRQR